MSESVLVGKFDCCNFDKRNSYSYCGGKMNDLEMKDVSAVVSLCLDMKDVVELFLSLH